MRTRRYQTPAPAAAPGSVIPWSYSKLAMFEKCPAQFRFRYIEKRPEEESDALRRGNAVHKAFEEFLTAKGMKPKMPPHVKPIGEYAIELRGRFKDDRPIIEQLWAHDAKWQETASRSATWLWVKMDLCLPSHNLVVDWKTGKKYDSHVDQARLYAVSFLNFFPDKPRVEVEFGYVDYGEVSSLTVERRELKALQKNFEARVKAMTTEERFAPKPSRLCDWCSYSKKKGGPCLAG